MNQPLRLLPVLAAGLWFTALPAAAQYKVVAPDGSVTYTDRPPAASSSKVTAMNRRGVEPASPVDAAPALPLELRQIVARFPVTLFASADCPPCDAGRALLQQRGVPYAEKRIASEEDAAALERAVGGRTVPALTIGAQALRGLSQNDWTSYLDAAGYPRESRLPRGWQPTAPVPLVERVTPPTRPAAVAPPPPVAESEAAAPAPNSAIKF
jgi:glutaredoxin